MKHFAMWGTMAVLATLFAADAAAQVPAPGTRHPEDRAVLPPMYRDVEVAPVGWNSGGGGDCGCSGGFVGDCACETPSSCFDGIWGGYCGQRRCGFRGRPCLSSCAPMGCQPCGLGGCGLGACGLGGCGLGGLGGCNLGGCGFGGCNVGGCGLGLGGFGCRPRVCHTSRAVCDDGCSVADACDSEPTCQAACSTRVVASRCGGCGPARCLGGGCGHAFCLHGSGGCGPAWGCSRGLGCGCLGRPGLCRGRSGGGCFQDLCNVFAGGCDSGCDACDSCGGSSSMPMDAAPMGTMEHGAPVEYAPTPADGPSARRPTAWPAPRAAARPKSNVPSPTKGSRAATGARSF